MEQLKNIIISKVQLLDTDLEAILSRFRPHTIKKGKLLIRQGQVVSDYYFVVNGGLRIYIETSERQVTGWIALEGDFFTELSSLKQEVPTKFNIHAIEHTELLLVSKTEMDLLYQTYPLWQQFGREIWEDAFLKVVDGILSYQTLTAEERYLIAMEKSELLQRVPLKDLSTYLGVTPNSLSRIRKNIK